jgi:Hemerythrin HHE cation binding domain
MSMNGMLHRAILREIDRVEHLVQAQNPQAARKHYEFLSGQLHSHHELEDEYLWPLVETRTKDEKELATLSAMTGEHEQLHETLDLCDQDFAGTGDLPDDCLAHLGMLRLLAAAHFAHEEADAEGLLVKYLSKDDLEAFHEASRKVPNSMLVFPWIADGGSPADQQVFDVLPGPVRLFVKPMMKRKYKAFFG